MTDIDAWHNPSEDHAPSRPGIKTMLATAAVILAGFAIAHAPAVSAFIHFPEIKAALGF